MRNFRKAALAGATAVAVAFGSTAVATAETKKPEATPTPTYTSYPAPVRDQKPGVDNDAEKTNGSSTKLGNSSAFGKRRTARSRSTALTAAQSSAPTRRKTASTTSLSTLRLLTA